MTQLKVTKPWTLSPLSNQIISLTTNYLFIFSIFMVIFSIKSLATTSEEYGDWFFQNNYYYRAITEYHKEQINNNHLRLTFKIARSYYHGQQYQTALEQINYLISTPSITPSLGTKAYLLKAKTLLNLNEYNQALHILNSDKIISQPGKVKFLQAHCYLFNNQPKQAKNIFKSIPPKSKYRSSSDKILTYMDQTQINLSNPYLAGSLSIIPGLGQLYAGFPKEAFISFTVNLILGYFIHDAFRRGKEILKHGYASFTAWLTIGIPFYVGNIYNAARLTKQANDKRYFDYYRRIEKLGYNDLLKEK